MKRGGKADGGGGGNVLEHRSALLCAWGRFEVTSGETATRESTLSLARTLFREAVDTCPGNAHAWVSWAHAEGWALRGTDGGEASTGIVRSGRRRASPAAARQLAVVDEGLRYWPDNVQLLHARALSLKTAGDLEGARRSLDHLSRRHPDNAHTWHAMGTLLQELGEFQEAVEAFERGAAAGPRAPNLVCLTSAAAAAHHGGDLDRARRLFMQGSGLASSGSNGGSFGSGGGGGGGEGMGSATDADGGFIGGGGGEDYSYSAAVNGEGAVYAANNTGSRYYASSQSSSSSSSFSSASFSSSAAAAATSAHDRASHLRLWALLEKRAGGGGASILTTTIKPQTRLFYRSQPMKSAYFPLGHALI